MRNFTPEEDQYLRDNYLKIPTKTMSKNLGRNESSARQRMKLLNIVVPADIAQQFRASSWMKKGSIPPNKGKKITDYVSPEAIARMQETQFKKGNITPNTKYDGAERICKDGYIEIRISLGKYVHKHRHEWEKINGPIPEGMILVCKSEDKLNSHPDNWDMITRVENMNRNSGPLNLTDNMVATYLAASSRKVDQDLKQEYLKHPDLIHTKRNHLNLNRKIKEYGTK